MSRAENDEEKQREDESDEDYAKRMEEKDKQDEEARKAEEEKKEEARKAEEEKKKEEEARARGEQDDTDPDAEDDDEEMRGKSAAARARLREQARCAAIFASPAAGRNPMLAANLAFKTRMSRAEALATLEGTPAPSSASHASRAARNPNLGVDAGAKQSPQQALAARWDANLKAANPSRR
ncbi:MULTISPECIES: hypothetical protein [unclassified Paraburkholderia]|uniref:hypothetical protein n=1 Tax=unclassified Paraburkholderia TaxID=2615204 RepID=UPI00160F8A3E|nr:MULTISPECIES: hypothetical protein [unclassified Paraburkholderia]MBB5444644.1 outer membrane biosynthesis protein TonB [Paraburkholderia sp. WSM4177]MBB5485469.1 outer membrane biosynthesis protein TonB [Paraburkholderia sp. WSM4180]